MISESICTVPLLESYAFKYWYTNISSFENFEDELNSLPLISKHVPIRKLLDGQGKTLLLDIS